MKKNESKLGKYCRYLSDIGWQYALVIGRVIEESNGHLLIYGRDVVSGLFYTRSIPISRVHFKIEESDEIFFNK